MVGSGREQPAPQGLQGIPREKLGVLKEGSQKAQVTVMLHDFSVRVEASQAFRKQQMFMLK